MQKSRLGLAGAAALSVGALMGATTGTGEHVAFAPKTVTVNESDGQAVVTVARDACENAAFLLDWSAPRTSTNDRGSATEDEDYEPTAHSGRWESCAPGTGSATQVFTVPIVDDDEAERPETINMSLRARTTSTNQTSLPDVDPDGTIVIADDDTFGLDLDDVAVDETAGVARIPVTRRGGPRGEGVDTTYWTSDLEAEAGADYTAVEGELTFADRGSVQTIEVPITADAAAEGAETFRLTVDRDDTEYRAIVTIRDVAPKPREEQPPAPTRTTAAASTGTTTATLPPPAPRPVARACTSRRHFTLALGRLTRAQVRVGGETMKVRRSKTGRLTAAIDLRGNPKGQYTVKITGRDAKGRSVAQIKRYRTCARR